MNWQNIALSTAGIIGGGVAIVHGFLVQRLMIKPFEALTKERLSQPIRRLVPLLLHFSTVSWLLGGLALIAAAQWLDGDTKVAVCIFVGGLYLLGALINLIGTRRFHPGWMLMAVALALIAVGLGASPPLHPHLG